VVRLCRDAQVEPALEIDHDVHAARRRDVPLLDRGRHEQPPLVINLEQLHRDSVDRRAWPYVILLRK
jgi:hypothetical protein